MLQRIHAVAGLGVGQVPARLDAEPEVGELIGERALAVYVHFGQVAGTDHKRTGMLYYCLHHLRDVGGAVLTVGVDGKGIIETASARVGQTRFQRVSLASVAGVGYYVDAVLESAQHFCGVVGAAVVHHYYIGSIFQHIGQYAGQRPGIVVCRDNHADAVAAHGLAD